MDVKSGLWVGITNNILKMEKGNKNFVRSQILTKVFLDVGSESINWIKALEISNVDRPRYSVTTNS